MGPYFYLKIKNEFEITFLDTFPINRYFCLWAQPTQLKKKKSRFENWEFIKKKQKVISLPYIPINKTHFQKIINPPKQTIIFFFFFFCSEKYRTEAITGRVNPHYCNVRVPITSTESFQIPFVFSFVFWMRERKEYIY